MTYSIRMLVYLPMLLKVALVPLLVLIASLVARRFGHTASGWIAGLPLIAGPLFVFLALDQGAVFATDAARAAVAVSAASILHCLVFARMCVRHGWVASLAAGWATFFAVGLPLAWLDPPSGVGLVFALAALGLTLRLIPRSGPSTQPVASPSTELGVRLAATFVLALVVTIGAPLLGPALSGLLLTFPISGSIIPGFTLALHGPQAAVQVLAGFTSGMISFALFLFGLAVGIPALGTWAAFGFALALALAGYFTMRAWR